jgi:hypothetical protein
VEKYNFRPEICTTSSMNVIEEARGIFSTWWFKCSISEVRINMQDVIAKDNVIDYIITRGNPLDAR